MSSTIMLFPALHTIMPQPQHSMPPTSPTVTHTTHQHTSPNPTHVHTRTNTHPHTHDHTHTHTPTQIRAHTHTHAHTHMATPMTQTTQTLTNTIHTQPTRPFTLTHHAHNALTTQTSNFTAAAHIPLLNGLIVTPAEQILAVRRDSKTADIISVTCTKAPMSQTIH